LRSHVGSVGSHTDTALALASAGFVVAAVQHTEDETIDTRYVGMPRWLADRRGKFT
jgi:predicted dienelactone hydrolase